MASFQGPGYGFSSQLAVNATAKKMAKSKVGKSMAGARNASASVLRATSRTALCRRSVRLQLATAGPRPGRSAPVLERVDEGGQHLVHVAHDAEVSHTEDRGVLVLLTATMFFDPFMPTRCWVAPEMPKAR